MISAPFFWITSFVSLMSSLLVIGSISAYHGVNLFNIELIEMQLYIFLISSIFIHQVLKTLSTKDTIKYFLKILEGFPVRIMIVFQMLIMLISLFYEGSFFGLITATIELLFYLFVLSLELKTKK